MWRGRFWRPFWRPWRRWRFWPGRGCGLLFMLMLCVLALVAFGYLARVIR